MKILSVVLAALFLYLAGVGAFYGNEKRRVEAACADSSKELYTPEEYDRTHPGRGEPEHTSPWAHCYDQAMEWGAVAAITWPIMLPVRLGSNLMLGDTTP